MRPYNAVTELSEALGYGIAVAAAVTRRGVHYQAVGVHVAAGQLRLGSERGHCRVRICRDVEQGVVVLLGMCVHAQVVLTGR